MKMTNHWNQFVHRLCVVKIILLVGIRTGVDGVLCRFGVASVNPAAMGVFRPIHHCDKMDTIPK